MDLPPYTASQLLLWIYQRRVDSFDDMSNLSKETRLRLEERFTLDALTCVDVQTASDGTQKFLCELKDGAKIECVLIPSEVRGSLTACLSSQVGCGMACDFCRTGKMGLIRNLTLGEITSQLRLVMKKASAPVTNIVFMGMGEPLANWKVVADVVDFMTHPQGFKISKTKITLSTSALLPQLREFCKRHDVKIAISLSATTNELRDKLMPINKKYPIEDIMQFCREYAETSRHRITFEYVLIAGVNDQREDAERLVKLLDGILAKVNLIPMNPFEGCDYKRPSMETYQWWSDYLREHGITAPVRISGGRDILAACGQRATAKLRR